MSRLPLSLPVALAAMLLATPAAAKELIRATICGSSACTTVTDRRTLELLAGGESTKALGAVSPYDRLEIVNAEPGHGTHSFFLYYVPAENSMAWGENGVVRLHPIYGDATTTLMRELVAGLKPFRAPRITSARVGARRITGPAAQSYLSLFAQGRESQQVAYADDWIAIDLRSAVGSPWTDGSPDLVYSPSENVLDLGYRQVELPRKVADDVEAGRALDPSGRPRSGLPWLLAAVGALSLAALHPLRRRGKNTGRPPV